MAHWKYRIAAITYFILVLVFLLIPVDSPPIWKPFWIKGLDKVIHLGIFALLYVLLAKASIEQGIANSEAKIIVFSLFFAVLTECLQGLTSYRSFEWKDVSADMIGTYLGYLFTCLCKKKF